MDMEILSRYTQSEQIFSILMSKVVFKFERRLVITYKNKSFFYVSPGKVGIVFSNLMTNEFFIERSRVNNCLCTRQYIIHIES
jgi:hypothetical protein